MIRFIRNMEACNRGLQQSSLIEGLGVHALRSDRAMTLEQIMEEHEVYSQQFPDIPVPNWSQLLLDLSINVSMHLIDVIDDTDRTHGVWINGRFTSHEAIEDCRAWAGVIDPKTVEEIQKIESRVIFSAWKMPNWYTACICSKFDDELRTFPFFKDLGFYVDWAEEKQGDNGKHVYKSFDSQKELEEVFKKLGAKEYSLLLHTTPTSLLVSLDECPICVG